MGQRLNPFGVLQVVHLVRQDLSIAGKRAGLAGARSGLFMEQVRIVKEMREADKRNGRTGDMVRPRYLVWENVVGAFSSNKGKDFAAVLEEIIKIVEEWAAAHPRKTRQSVFLEQWPNARPADDGVLTFCPKRFDFHISCLAECHSLKKCSDCRREFWGQEVE